MIRDTSDIPICQQPWFELQIEYNNNVGCCCYYQYSRSRWDFNRPFEVEKYWNDQFFRNLREIVSTKRLSGTGCYNCDSLKYDMNTNLFSEIPSDLTPKQRENFQKSYDNYLNGSYLVNSYPVKYYLNCGLACNIKCRMCSQKIERSVNKSLLPTTLFDDIKPFFPYANEVSLIGGEPFLLPNALYFIKRITQDPALSNLKLSLVTNGTLIHHHFDHLKQIKRLHLSFSLDAVGKVYETIRIGAQWDRVERNLLNAKEHADKNNLPWSFSTGIIIMKTTLLTLIDTIKWHIRHDIPMGFSNLCLQHYTLDENIIEYPEILISIPNWYEIFDESITMLEEKKWINSAKNLKAIKSQVIANAEKRCPYLTEGFSTKTTRGSLIHTDTIDVVQNMPLVSIITICLNGMPYIKDCIESILNQTYPNIEYIIQDGGSTDGTVELIRQYAQKYPNKIKWASEKDSGHGEAMNRALKRCSGEIIGTCNDDDILLPHAVSWAVVNFQKPLDAGAIYGDYVEIDANGSIKSMVCSGPNPYLYERVLCVIDVIPMQSAFFRRASLIDSGIDGDGWLPKHCEDFAFWVNLGFKYKVLYTAGLVSKYRVHSDSESSQKNYWHNFYTYKREVLERFFLSPDVPDNIRLFRNLALGGLALSVAEMFLTRFAMPMEAMEYVKLARAEQPDKEHLNRLGSTIKRWDCLISQVNTHAQNLINEGKYQDALLIFDLFQPLDYWYVGFNYLRAICLKGLNRDEEANNALQMELFLHPDFKV